MIPFEWVSQRALTIYGLREGKILPLAQVFFCATLGRRDITWRGGRVVEGAALEMLFGGNVNEGSNPSLSVDKLKVFLLIIR